MNLHLTASRSAKDNLKTGNFFVTLNFSENFVFVVQEAVEGFHWNNNTRGYHYEFFQIFQRWRFFKKSICYKKHFFYY